jgi:Ca-activated chloride channel homolog
VKNHLAIFGALVTALTLAPRIAAAQAGVLMVEGSENADPSVLALAEMDIRVRIDHLHAAVSVTQIFENRTSRSLRGRYELALGREAAVSAFALWEGEHRREAVVVERERGRRIFEDLTRRDIDPGLLETSDQGPRQNIYAVRVDPIGPYDRVRLEVDFSQELELGADEALFVFPLAGRDGIRQNVERLRVTLEVEGAWPLEAIELLPESLRINGTQRDGLTSFQAELDQREATLDSDLMVSLRLARDPAQPLRPVFLAHRADLGPAGRIDRSAFGGGRRYTDERGYFMIRTPIQLPAPTTETAERQDVVIALDTSLSMRGGKLERAVAAIESLLEELDGRDRYTLVTFNDEVRALPGGLAAPSAERNAQARRFFRESYLSGGTDLRRAVPASLELLQGSTAARRMVVLVTDGQPSLGSLESSALTTAAASANEALGASRGRLFILGVGDDSNHILLQRLADESSGHYAHVGEGADITPIMRRFLFQLQAEVVEGFHLDVEGLLGVEDLYPSTPTQVFDGSSHVVFGRYTTPTPNARFRLAGQSGRRAVEEQLTAELPRRERERPWIARGWARRRVADLLGRIDAEGEREEWIREIVALAREHLLVTPYTSLIAAARTSLRPREITPGDPVLRVRTSPSDRSVTAIFPFGLVKPLRRLEPGLFETRFLAPTHLGEGRQEVDLVITGQDGRRRVVRDHFIIDSRAPQPLIDGLRAPLRAGDRVQLRVRSDQDTRHLHAFLQLPGAVAGETPPPTELRWDAHELACTGELTLPAELPTGRYRLVVIAEDHAHNVGSAAIQIEVMSR